MRSVRRVLIALLVAAGVWWWLTSGGGGVSIEPGSVLVLDVSGGYVEAAESPLIGRLIGERRQTFVSLLSELRKAERDDRLDGVVLRIRPLDVGWAKAQELRDAIGDLRAAGRSTLAYLEVGSLGANLEFYVASAAEEVWIARGAASPLIGLAAQYLFLGGLWEKLGAGVETAGVGEYKSATETLAGTGMSEPFREMADSLLDSVDAQFVDGIASSRGVPRERVRDAIAGRAQTAEELMAADLVDGVGFLDEAVERLGGGPVVRSGEYAGVDPASVGFEPVASFALVYGSGLVTMGSGQVTPSGSLRMTSDTVSEALEDAAGDEEIDAIILRIDSPGGSPLAAEILWQAVASARESKPLIVSISDVAASGGYYVASAGDAIVAPAASLVGSIGVFVIRPFVGGLLENLGIGVETLTRGPHADLLLFAEPLREESRARLRREIETIYDLFVERVASGRGLERERVDAVARGRVWTGAQAEERGLVDAIGGLRTAVARAKQALALAPDDDVALVPYPPPSSLADQIDSLLRRIAADAAPPLPLPEDVLRLGEWLAALPQGAPALVPPLLVEIR